MIIKVFRHIYHLSIYTFAAITLTVAVCVSLFRLALPNINEYRLDVQTWMTEYMGQPVEIKNIDATWFGWIPHFYLHDISILEETGNETIANFKSAHITIDLIESLRKKQLIPAQLSISGLDLTLIRRVDGSINIAKTEAEMGEKNIESTELAVWLLKQPNISLADTQITLLDLTRENNNTVLLSNVSLLLRSNSYRLQLEGDAQLPAQLGKKIHFALDAKGDILTTVWSGELYLEGSSIYPPAWFNKKIPFGINIDSKPGDIKIWSEWQNAKIRKIEGTIDITDVSINSNETEFNIDHLITAIYLERRTDGGLDLSLNIEKLTTDHGSWPTSTIFVSKYFSDDDQYRYISKSSYLKLDDISHIIKLFPDLWRDNKLIEQQSLQGVLTHSLLIYDPSLPDNQKYFVDTDINLSSASIGTDKNGITGLNGHLQGNAKQGKFTISSHMLEFDVPKLFKNKIKLYEIDGDISWQKEKDNFVVTTDYFDAHTEDFNAYLKGHLVFRPETELPFADIIMGISNANLEDINNYMPSNIPGKARTWFNSALVGGELTSADIILRGELSDYPFLNNEGQFKAIAEIENVTLEYSQNWAPIDNMDAELIIEKNNLTVNIGTGKIFNADIIQAIATIHDLSADKLFVEVDGLYSGHTNDGKLFIEQSPLVDNPALKIVSQSNLDGEFDIDLNIVIPIGGGSNKFNGKLTFHDASLYTPYTGIKLNNINGDVVFSENLITANNIKTTYFDHDVYLNIQSDTNGLPISSLTGTADKEFIIEQLSHYFPDFIPYASILNDRMSGACEWQVELSFPESAIDINSARKLTIKSPLSGLTLDFPAPLEKMYEAVPFELSTIISNATQQNIDIQYGDILTGKFELDKSLLPKLKTAEFNFGSHKTNINTRNGITVTGNIDRLVLSEWMELINELDTSAFNKGLDTLSVGVDISSFGLMNQKFDDVNLALAKQDSNWKLDINGDDIKGDITISEEPGINPVIINFDRLVISKNDSESTLDPREIPPLQASIKNFQYEDIKLGKFLLDTTKTMDGMSIDNFSFNKPGLEISGNGDWTYMNDKNKSSFAIKVQASQIDNMLETFNYSVAAIKDGETNLKIDANWDGSPTDFSLQKLDGGMQLNIDKGRFLDIEPKAGRLFGLLSLQTLPRRLSLDFSDLFSKGLSFDEISGDFTIEDGNAYTNNLAMEGPSAEIVVTGRTGLSRKDYDQLVTVTPQVSDSLPIASALFGPIGLGIGAVLFLAGEMFDSIPRQIDKLLRYQYTITGSWDNPVIERINKKQESNGNDTIIGVKKHNTSYLTQ